MNLLRTCLVGSFLWNDNDVKYEVNGGHCFVLCQAFDCQPDLPCSWRSVATKLRRSFPDAKESLKLQRF